MKEKIETSLVNSSGGNLLYGNNKDSTFSDVTRSAGVGYAGECVDAVFADYDGDGDSDIYVVREGGANILYRNSRKH